MRKKKNGREDKERSVTGNGIVATNMVIVKSTKTWLNKSVNTQTKNYNQSLDSQPLCVWDELQRAWLPENLFSP